MGYGTIIDKVFLFCTLLVCELDDVKILCLVKLIGIRRIASEGGFNGQYN